MAEKADLRTRCFRPGIPTGARLGDLRALPCPALEGPRRERRCSPSRNTRPAERPNRARLSPALAGVQHSGPSRLASGGASAAAPCMPWTGALLARPEGKEEPLEETQEHWEAQQQEFLETGRPVHTTCGNPGLSEAAPWEDAKAFLASFEQVAKAFRWPRGEWAARLLPTLSGEAEQAFRSLEAGDQEDYGKVKAAILRGEALRREVQRQLFRQFCCQEVEDPRRLHRQLQELCRQWLKPERHSKEQILELLILEQFLASLPPDLQGWMRALSRPFKAWRPEIKEIMGK
ncbi:neurotrophin receptor-interacting factor 1-like [Varanus komodoensis]|uniref:neurotrophin receptor-interacting factor 1-like n=1 Tax=Varanus komodoensis TaxID=61221 RepID=UPI001CF7C8C4|nr:neurotrophin receptor-interacting factor 1-like [Varanus komodoensis]